jgi:hypothetical protein
MSLGQGEPTFSLRSLQLIRQKWREELAIGWKGKIVGRGTLYTSEKIRGGGGGEKEEREEEEKGKEMVKEEMEKRKKGKRKDKEGREEGRDKKGKRKEEEKGKAWEWERRI